MSEPGIRIGLTGGFGTGKSTVAAIFKELGTAVVDADELARAALQPGREEYREAIEQFGDRILAPSGGIDRKALADLVFSDPGSRERLNRIVHPAVIREMEEILARSPARIKLAVIPLLFETGLEGRFDYLIVVALDEKTAQERTAVSRGMTAEEIASRQAAQLPLAEKIRRADFVIDNSGSRSETRRRVEELLKILTGSEAQRSGRGQNIK